MQILNLIRPEKSDVKYEVIQFPDGEPHIVLNGIDRKDDLTVVCRICNPTDLFILMQVGDILNRLGSHYPDRERTIYVTHMVNPKGITTLSENYKEVYLTNPDNVKVIEIV